MVLIDTHRGKGILSTSVYLEDILNKKLIKLKTRSLNKLLVFVFYFILFVHIDNSLLVSSMCHKLPTFNKLMFIFRTFAQNLFIVYSINEESIFILRIVCHERDDKTKIFKTI